MTTSLPQAAFDMSTVRNHHQGVSVDIIMGDLRRQVIITMKALVGSFRPDRVAGRTPAEIFRAQPATFFDLLKSVTEKEMRMPMSMTWN